MRLWILVVAAVWLAALAPSLSASQQITVAGVHLGESESAMLKQLGKPEDKRKLASEVVTWSYGWPSRGLIVRVQAGKVIWIQKDAPCELKCGTQSLAADAPYEKVAGVFGRGEIYRYDDNKYSMVCAGDPRAKNSHLVFTFEGGRVTQVELSGGQVADINLR